MLQYVLGIVKAYTTRVGSGPFPTELFDEVGAGLAQRGNEFGSVTGRPRRCGWFDAAALKRSIQINGITGMCITKLDVMDGIEEIKICTGYEFEGKTIDILPFGADAVAKMQTDLRNAARLERIDFRRKRIRRVAGKRQALPETD